MMATQLFFFPLQGRHAGLTITFSEWKRDYFGRLLSLSTEENKNSLFPLVSIFFRYSITHLFSDLQKALCLLWLHHIMEETSKVQWKCEIQLRWKHNSEENLALAAFSCISYWSPLGSLRSYFNTDLPSIVWFKTLTFIKLPIYGTWLSFLNWCQIFV